MDQFKRRKSLTNCTNMTSSSLRQIKYLQLKSVARGQLGTEDCQTEALP